jgi:hypothetical protein
VGSQNDSPQNERSGVATRVTVGTPSGRSLSDPDPAVGEQSDTRRWHGRGSEHAESFVDEKGIRFDPTVGFGMFSSAAASIANPPDRPPGAGDLLPPETGTRPHPYALAYGEPRLSGTDDEDVNAMIVRPETTVPGVHA